MKWHGAQAKKRLRANTGQILLALAIELESEHKKDLGYEYPPASKPGQFPHGRTWNLRESVTHEPESASAVAARREVRVGYADRARYIVHLLQMKRLGLHTTLNRIRTRLTTMAQRWGLNYARNP